MRIAAVLLCAPLLAASGQATVIRAGRLLDPATGAVGRDQRIVVEDGRITAVGADAAGPAGATVIDLSAYTVLPGLIDAHVHLTIGGAVRDNAIADLNAGFTTIVDLGSRGLRLLALRDSINAGHVPGPRVLAAGIWVGTKDGVCEFGGIGIAGGPDGFRERVRGNVEAGADVIKACVSGWPAAAFARQDAFEMAEDALAATVREAHAAKRLVLAHAISRGAVQASLRAGVDGLAHAAYVDAPIAAEMKRAGQFLIPTLASLTGGDTSAASRALVTATRTAYVAGVMLVFGTDGGVLPHGRNAEEFLALEAAGVTPLDAVRSATTNAARAFRLDSLGAIAPGKVADIIAIDGHLLGGVDALTRVRFVMSRGRIMRSPN